MKKRNRLASGGANGVAKDKEGTSTGHALRDDFAALCCSHAVGRTGLGHFNLRQTHIWILLYGQFAPISKLLDDTWWATSQPTCLAAYAADRDHDEWLALSGPLRGPSGRAKWMAENVLVGKAHNSGGQFSDIARDGCFGSGIAVLPCFVGDPGCGIDHRLTIGCPT
jgi:hypothetical protein